MVQNIMTLVDAYATAAFNSGVCKVADGPEPGDTRAAVFAALTSLEAQLNEYIKCADDMAMSHKIERDTLMLQIAEYHNSIEPEIPMGALQQPEPFASIGRKWIAYAQSDYDVNDIAVAVWAAIRESTIAQGRLNETHY